MLTALTVRNIVLIENLELDLAAGLTVLTGETGAGKSILLDALGLALGGRGSATLVRQGADEGSVAALFETSGNDEIIAFLEQSGIPFDGQIVLRRIQKSDGKSKAFVNDQTVTVQTLARLGQMMVEIHGQHEARALMDQEAYRNLLDTFGELHADVCSVEKAWTSWRKAKSELEDHQAALASIQERAGYLSHALEELNQLSPGEREEDELVARRQRMMSAEKLSEVIDDAVKALSPDKGLQALISAHNQIGAQIEQNKEAKKLFGGVFDAINKVLIEADDAMRQAFLAQRESHFDRREQEKVEVRLFALRGLARKHKVPVSSLSALHTRISSELEQLDLGEQHLDELQKQVDKGKQDYLAKAEKLHKKRVKSATQLDKKISAELAPLKLDKAKFITNVDKLDEGKEGRLGLSRVTFNVQTNPGMDPGPLGKVASGGELSRFMLALKVVLADKMSAPTLVFDEIDTGVGGATATAIGQRLAQLGEKWQVLCVTHAPQVAAFADTHFHISKGLPGGNRREEKIATNVAKLDEKARKEELARMLSGAKVTDEARAAAEQLMQS